MSIFIFFVYIGNRQLYYGPIEISEGNIMPGPEVDSFDRIVDGLGDVRQAGADIIESHNQDPFGTELLTNTGRDAYLGDIACAAQRGSRLDDEIIHTGGGEGVDDSYYFDQTLSTDEAKSLV